MSKLNIAVLLAGCGNRDGSEIHEATLTLLAIHTIGADYQCYAPDIEQHHVLNHITGQAMDESRNVLIESARIARGNILPAEKFDFRRHDALIIPGGLGAVKNLCSYALDGRECTINPATEQMIRTMHERKKPIGALCIAPALLAHLFTGITITLGGNSQAASDSVLMGAHHQQTSEGEIVVDKEHRLVTTPCYMFDSRVDSIALGAERLVKAVVDLI